MMLAIHNLYAVNNSCSLLTTITLLAILAILVGATMSVAGFSVVSSVDAQTTGDNATMSGNMTGGNMTGQVSDLKNRYQYGQADPIGPSDPTGH